jgi:diguanylate cyclase (GGDEF)-like protein/PAS domain S-box-containing protein
LQHRANALRVIGRFMFRMSHARPLTDVALAGLVLAGAGSAWLFASVIAEGRELTAAEGFVLHLLVAAGVFFGLGWLVLRQHWRGRLQQQQEIDEAKRKLDTAVGHMSQGLVMFDAHQRIALCNRRYMELYGVSPAVVKPGLSFRELLIHRKESGSFFGDVEEYCTQMTAAVAAGTTTSLTVKSSRGRLVRIVNEPLDGGGWVATHEDVTERQQLLESHERSEKLLGEQRHQLDVALNNMTHGICMFDAEGRIVLFNRRYSEMMGQTAEYLRGLSLLDLFRHRKATGAIVSDPDELFSSIMASMREGKTSVREMMRLDGIALRVVDTPLEGGGWVATHEDVTEQRRTERERDRNRAFLDLIIDNVPSAIFVKSAADRRYVLVNRAGENFWGVSRNTMVGKTARELFPNAEAARIEARDDELLQSGTALFDERELITPVGGLRHISSRRLTIRDKSNEARYVLGVIDDVTERKAAEARIAQLAHYDPLTNLPNRTLFREQLETELAFVRRGAKLAVLYLDLDHFKSINDTLGHPAGDELLKAVAERLRNCLRESDLIARLGGDEFAIVQTQLQDPQDAVAFALRLREAVTSASYDLSGHQTTTDSSIGIALSPEDGTEIDELVKHADLALYGAKADGRANHRFFEPGMNARMKQRRGLEIDLRSALANDELELHYQPLINLQTGAIVCCEALVRWHHPVRGMIPPLEFIPVAEETGLINAIGDWVLRRACVEAMNWPSDVSVAVNVSPVQFRSPALALGVVASLAASGLPTGRLELEITESVLMQNNSATLALLHQIRDLGVRISMDDFGTGYSSLSYLRSFPFDKIKIDRSFIGDLSKGDDAVAIVHAILNLANSLKMTTTAEGVETADQKKLLQAAGCNEMQGYLFSPPRRAAEIAELFASHRRPDQAARG